MVEIERGRRHFGQLRPGIAVDTLAPLLEDDVALGQHHLVAQHEVRHAVRLDLHHQVQPIDRERLEVGGVIDTGEGVLRAAVARDDAREFARRQNLGALEHQMLEEMSDAGNADRLVGGADFVPDHLGGDRCDMVLHHHHLEAIGQREHRRIENPGLTPAGGRKGDEKDCQQGGAERHRSGSPGMYA